MLVLCKDQQNRQPLDQKKLEWTQITKIGNETLYNINNFTKIKGLLQNTMNDYTSKKLANLHEMDRFIKG